MIDVYLMIVTPKTIASKFSVFSIHSCSSYLRQFDPNFTKSEKYYISSLSYSLNFTRHVK